MKPSTSSPPPDPPPVSSDRRPTHWLFCKILRQVREKRCFTPEEACLCLPGVSRQRLEQWERGTAVPLFFIGTLVIWRLNTAPHPKMEVQSPTKSAKRIFVPGIFLIGFATLVIYIAAGALNSTPKTPPSLATMISESASRAVGYPVPPEACEDYATRLKAILRALDKEDVETIFGKLAALAESISE